MVVPTGAKSAQFFLCVSPRGYIPCQSPRAPGRALPPEALHHRPVVGAAGAGAGTAPCRVLETLGLCFKFQGHELFPGKKNGQIKQKANNTHEGGGFDWGFGLDFNRVPRSWARNPPLQGTVARGADGRSRSGCRGDTVDRKLWLRSLWVCACLWEGPVSGVTQQPLSWHCEPLGVTPDSDHPLPGLGKFSVLPAAILIRLSPTPR